MGFYEEIAAYYDTMTRFQERMPGETAMLKTWVERYQFHSVVDIACGTGLHAIILAQLGLRTVGADISAVMLNIACDHAREMGVEATWIQTSMEQARYKIQGKYKAVFCLGNSLPHLLNHATLQSALKSFYSLLSPGGIVVIQLLNYHHILAEQQRIIGIHRQGTTEFVRFYDFYPDRIRFNVLSIDWQNGIPVHTLNSTPLYPYQKDELESVLATQGFGAFEYYGNMTFHPFEELSSPNLVMVARKNERT
ncbi:putative methyltransferase [Candidatus Vecturithrix granuli]|uniref:Putative methyltransferase n=1 Tax=Vecturithrix granuli TaxID=1499967 RepID=A0A081BYE6_VECG1|nr:putative methyltransferase [Candidatus Vecturithrix granuli]